MLRSPQNPAAYDSWTAVGLAIAALACVGAWIAAGAPVPTSGTPSTVTTPFVLVLSYIGRSDAVVVAHILAWLMALPVAVAAGIALLIVLRVRRGLHAQRLVTSLAATSAGFAALFVAPNFVPAGGWLPPAGVGFAVLATLCAAVALVGWGSWLECLLLPAP